ncbi:glycosyltransferase, GT2 family [Lentimicrobium saccharophilum]|uniref:Glycosyltransferase, GT2 family n=1 Tax=Lentimicrobium saccharophilum TaxID=1678841 RepID=A0A0S7C0K7_9BACT|nr:glycosyltransferase family 2 protein [Lentimicrobium saccharophilum]GAP42355.1 glycosyltransferase, GT2 family [Lentimicrobium saccharophilum]
MNNSNLVACITINYNHAKDTINCVNSLLESDYSNFIIFLIDNGSHIDDYRILSEFTSNAIIIRLLRIEKNVGYVGGVNYGLTEAAKINPDYYLIMNNDTVIDKHAIKALVDTSIDFSNNCIVSGKVYNMDNPSSLQYIGQWERNANKLDFPPYIKNSKEIDNGQYEQKMEVAMLDDIYWLIPAIVLNKIGLYSDYFYLYGEQNDYALRAKKNGVKLIYTPLAKLWHHHHLTTGGNKQKELAISYWRMYSSLTILYLHFSRKAFYTFYFKQFFRSLVKSILFMGDREKRENSKYKLLACWYFSKWMFNKKPNLGFNPYAKN